jgi:SpoVK/Ycf46/Vps4 family AAA+-type ATPase
VQERAVGRRARRECAVDADRRPTTVNLNAVSGCYAQHSYPNALLLTTSNLCEAVDPAFLDRADIKRYIGPPSEGAIYTIFASMVRELQRVLNGYR